MNKLNPKRNSSTKFQSRKRLPLQESLAAAFAQIQVSSFPEVPSGKGFSIEEGALYSNHWRHHVHISLNLSANFSTSLINQKMLGISYGEIFVIIGATAALIGPKDLPIIARTTGRLAGRAVGYVQVARGQFDSVMQQSQVNQVHKELQDTMAQLEAIRYEIRNISIMNPVPFTRRLEGMELPTKNGAVLDERSDTDRKPVLNIAKDLSSAKTNSSSLYSEALAYGRLAETPIIKSSSPQTSQEKESLNDRDGLLSVLPISAESAGLLPRQNGNLKGSDIVLESIVEAEVARNAKQFFSRPENQVPKE